MARFNDLPTETLLTIIRNVHPNDLDSLVLTSQRMYMVSSAIRERHNEMKKIYSTAFSGRSDKPRLAEVLGDVLQDPGLAYYVKNLVVDGFSDCWDTGDLTQRHKPYESNLMARLKEAALNVLPKPVATSAANSIAQGSEAPIISLMLYLLPNLSKVSYLHFDFGFDERRTSAIMNTLSHIASIQGPEAPLSRLASVNINGDDAGPAGADLTVLQLFASLPSVRQLHAWNIFHPETNTTFGPDIMPRDCHIIDLKVTNASIAPKDLHIFLGGFPALQSFEWNGTFWGLSDDQFFDPFWTRVTLLTYAKHSLRTLTLLSQRKQWRWTGDLRGFESLTDLTIELELLIRESDTMESVPILGDILPLTVKRLRLHTTTRTDGEQNLPRLVSTWASHKECMCGLEALHIITDRRTARLALYQRPLSYAKLVKKCKKVGVRLTVATSRPYVQDEYNSDYDDDIQSDDEDVEYERAPQEDYGDKMHCVCMGVDDGDKVRCRGRDRCRYAYFHTACVGFFHMPEQPWYCLDCEDALDSPEASEDERDEIQHYEI